MAAGRRDYYEVLGVPRDADAAAIKDAFRRLALRYHPDRNREPGAEDRFKEIAEAYAVLSDPKKRAGYDARGFAGVEGLSAEDLFGGVDFQDLFGGLGFDFDFGPGASPFDRFFHRRRGVPAKGANRELELELPLEQVVTGCKRSVSLEQARPCPDCKGSGAKPGTEPRACPACGGSGQRTHTRQEGNVRFQQIATCGECGGQGRIIDAPCTTCAGRGQKLEPERLELTVPAGVEDGMVLRVKGKGLPGPEGGVPGDLYVVVRTAPDPRFVRRGADLWREETLAVPDAVLGTGLDVPTLDGRVTVEVPPGTQPDTVLRLHDKGLPRFRSGGRGDLYVQVRVRVPEHPSAQERDLYERLREARRGT